MALFDCWLKTSSNLPQELLKLAFIGLVHSRLEYASAIFASASNALYYSAK